MFTYRQIHVQIWKDAWFVSLTPSQRFLFIYLFSNERAHVSGVYEMPFPTICHETGLRPQVVRQALALFQESGRICYDEATGDLFVRTLMRYNGANVLANAKLRTHVRNHRDKDGARIQYWDRWREVYPEIAERLSMPDPSAAGEQRAPEGEKEKEPEKDLEKEKEEERQKEPPGPASPGKAPAGGGPSRSVGRGSVGQVSPRRTKSPPLAPEMDGALRLWEQARQEPANDLDRQRLHELAQAAEEHRLSLDPGAPGAADSGFNWLCQAIQAANGARKPGLALGLNFLESVLQRWMKDGFQAAWGGEPAGAFRDVQPWGSD